MKTNSIEDIMIIEKYDLLHIIMLRRGNMGNSVLYLNELDSGSLGSPFIYIYGVRVLGEQLEVLAFSDTKKVELTINGKLCSRQKNDAGEFDFVVDMPAGNTVIRTAVSDIPDKFDEVSVSV